jgi:iron-sulfur cluster repair protein YtfE (RIC family)
MMTPFELLKKDHKKVAGLLERCEKAVENERDNVEDLFEQIKNELEVHTRIEETIFYPALKDKEETKDIALEAYEEHKVVKTLLEELEDLSTEDEEWKAKFTVLKENIEHHVEEEEGEMFKKARKALSQQEITELGERMQEEKKRETAEVE